MGLHILFVSESELIYFNQYFKVICLRMDTEWCPHKILQEGKFALCVLNQPVLSSSKLISVWNKAKFRVTVDGGTSIWAKIVNNAPDQEVFKEVPDLITGDFDSADMTHVKQFESLGSKVVSTPDQDYTDFTKCLQELSVELTKSNKLSDVRAVFAFVESSGRLDQIMANIQTLFLASKMISCPVYLLSSYSLTWLLAPGHHSLKISDLVTDNSHCGLIPLDGKAVVSTSGLKWNLQDGTLRFGELVSTSNGFDLSKDVVRIKTDAPLLWTMDFDCY